MKLVGLAPAGPTLWYTGMGREFRKLEGFNQQKSSYVLVPIEGFLIASCLSGKIERVQLVGFFHFVRFDVES